jgi:hypothetical protein
MDLLSTCGDNFTYSAGDALRSEDLVDLVTLTGEVYKKIFIHCSVFFVVYAYCWCFILVYCVLAQLW